MIAKGPVEGATVRRDCLPRSKLLLGPKSIMGNPDTPLIGSVRLRVGDGRRGRKSPTPWRNLADERVRLEKSLSHHLPVVICSSSSAHLLHI